MTEFTNQLSKRVLSTLTLPAEAVADPQYLIGQITRLDDVEYRVTKVELCYATSSQYNLTLQEL